MYQYNATVINVVDGDTIDVSVDLGFDTSLTMRLRLLGINTPETRTKNLEEKARGLAAKERVKQLIENKKVVIHTEKDSTEKYGRYLATVFIDDIDVNQLLIKEGHAVVYDGGKR